MLGEERGMEGVVVKQLVPRGSADRTGSVRVGDQLLRVGDEDVSRQTVSNMRHLIIGEVGSFCDVTFRSLATGRVYTVKLQRGTPEFLDSLDSAQPSNEQPRSHRSQDSYRSGAQEPERLYRSNNSSVIAGERAQQPGDGRASLQEENDWLRSALRLAEAHIKKDKEELKSLHAIFERNKSDTDSRIRNLEEQVAQRDAERRELEARVWQADEKLRAADTKLGEAARREQAQLEESRQVYENEQMRLEYIQELKRRFEDEKRSLESELVRMHDGLRTERARRIEAETQQQQVCLCPGSARTYAHTSSDTNCACVIMCAGADCKSAGCHLQVSQDLQRVQEAYRNAMRINHEGAERVKEQADKMRDIQRQNSSLTIMLSEILPRLTVLEQDVFSARLPRCHCCMLMRWARG